MVDWAGVRAKVRAWVSARPVIPAAYESLLEAGFVFIFSNAFLLVLLIVTITNTAKAAPSIALTRSVIGNAFTATEVLVYLLALLAPALWIMFYHWRARRHAFLHFVLLIVQLGIIGGSAVIYALAKSTRDPLPNPEFVGQWALSCYVMAIVIWYITLVYEKWLRSLTRQQPPESGKQILKELG